MEGFDAAVASYAAGNSLFHQGRYDDALEPYSTGISQLQGTRAPFDEEGTRLLIKLLLNCSQCRLLTRDYDGTAKDCQSVLALDPTNSKALIRRASALQCIGRYTEALSLLDDVLELKLPDSLQRAALKLRSDIRALHAQDIKVKRSEGVPISFVTDHQVIKLALGSPHMGTVALNSVNTIKLCLGNEFGLFNKELLPTAEGEAIKIKATIVDIEEISVKGVSIGDILCVKEHGNAEFKNSGMVDYVFEIFCESDKQSLIHNCKESSQIHVIMRFECTAVLSSGKAVVPILTLPLGVVPTSKSADESTASEDRGQYLLNLSQRIEAQCIREVPVPEDILCGGAGFSKYSRFLAFECPGYLGIGGKVWDSTYVLFKYLQGRPELLRNKRVIELGSGTGLAGIALSCLQPSSVCLTDFANVTGLLSANVELNQPILKYFMNNKACGDDIAANTNPCKYMVAGYAWGAAHYEAADRGQACAGAAKKSVSDLFRNCDVAVASDVVYDPIGYAPLFKAITEFLTRSNAPISSSNSRFFILAHRHRNPEDNRFFCMLDDCPDIEYWEDAWSEESGKAITFGGGASDEKIETGDKRLHSLTTGNVRIFVITTVNSK